MNRRHWLRNAVLLSAFGWGSARAEDTANGAADLQRRWQSFLPPQHDLSLDLTPLTRSKGEWQKLLPGDSYAVLFDEATEPPFTRITKSGPACFSVAPAACRSSAVR